MTMSGQGYWASHHHDIRVRRPCGEAFVAVRPLVKSAQNPNRATREYALEARQKIDYRFWRQMDHRPSPSTQAGPRHSECIR